MADRSRKLFETLVRQNEAAVMTCLRMMVRDPGLADDLFQETFITAWNRFDQFDQSRPLGPWLRGIAINLARNAARKKRRERQVIEFGEPMRVAVEDTLALLDDADELSRREALADCIGRLPTPARDLVRQRYEENKNASVIASLSQSNASRIRKRLQRIRSTLADCVSQKLAEPAR